MPESDYRPSVVKVAALLRTRTRDSNGVELGMFTSATRPTATEVEAIIDEVLSELAGQVADRQGNLPAPLHDQARRCVSLGVAATIELSYFTEQAAADRSAATGFREMHEGCLKRLERSASAYAPAGSAGGGAGLGTMVVRGHGALESEDDEDAP